MMHHNKSLLPSENNVLQFGCRKMACVRGEELIFLAFLMKSLHQPVSNKTVKLWRLPEGHCFCLWILQCTSFLCYYTIPVACIIAGFQAKSVIVQVSLGTSVLSNKPIDLPKPKELLFNAPLQE